MFSAEFEQHPKSKIEDVIESIRFLSPISAVEEGISTITHEPGEPGESGHYCVIYVKQDGKWLIASDRDLPDDDATSKSELEQLGWLVGSWVDESSEGLVKTRYEWAENHRFILGEYAVHIAGKPVLTGSQRIGWDPLARKVRSWVFDSEGGFGDGYWIPPGAAMDRQADGRDARRCAGFFHIVVYSPRSRQIQLSIARSRAW